MLIFIFNILYAAFDSRLFVVLNLLSFGLILVSRFEFNLSIVTLNPLVSLLILII